ncbi:MAG: hypothetical protein N2578_07845, partial [Bdellovibrionaceae bacterium]|nr:hypothetical protein [Pseudobdellovibrionaceae bacterium]
GDLRHEGDPDPPAARGAGERGERERIRDRFWSPERPGCRLEKDKHYFVFRASVLRVKNTKVTYPEYARLVDADGVIRMSLLMGMDDPAKGRDPNTSRDINADNFKDIKSTLLKSGYKSQIWNRSEILRVTNGKTDRGYVETFRKTLIRDGRPITLELEVFFGPSGISEDSTAFHWFFKRALETKAIMMYDGHSGLGGHLDLESIEAANQFKIQPNKNKYQIYFFNSCSSYTYYNKMYFSRKRTSTDPRGTKNLDIFTNGLATYFHVMHDTNMALIRAVEAWASGKATISYQALAAEIDSDNLFGINGDEDNPTRP